MPTPLLPVELEALIEQNITDELDQQNTAQRVREVFLYMVASLGQPGAPGTPGNPDYAALMLELAKKADRKAVETALAQKEPKFTPFTQAELTTVEYAYSNLALKPLLRELIRAAASGGGGGGSSVFTADIPVSLAGGRTFGKFANGSTIPAKGKTANDVILLAAVEDIYPTYATASVQVSQSAPADGEVGESLQNTITGSFSQGDAGPATALRAYRGNQAQIGASSATSPIVRPVQMVRSLTPTGIWVVADYAAGSPKPVAPAGTPDTRPAQVRNPNAPQAAEVGLSSPILYYTGYYRNFYGPTSAVPTTSAAVRALAGQPLTNGPKQFVLNTGTTQRIFAIELAPGQTLVSVIDQDALNKDITAEYVAGNPIQVADASGTAMASYTSRVKVQAAPYDTSHRHLITLG